MSELVKKLREKRAVLWESMKELADRAANENRSFDGEEERRWSEGNRDLDEYDARIKVILDGEKREKATEDLFDEIHGTPRGERQAAHAGRSEGSRPPGAELRSFLRGQAGESYTIGPSAGTDFRTLVKGTLASGGYTVASGFYDRLVSHLIETSGLLRAGPTVLNTSSGESMMVPKTTAHYTAAIVTEASALAVSESVFGQVSLGAFKYGGLFQLSRELVEDNGVDLEGYLSQSAGRALGNAMGQHFVVGTGTTQPSGLVVGATGAVTGASGLLGYPTVDNLIDLHYSVIAPYRASPSCGWLMADSTVGKIRKLKDTTGQYLWQQSMVAGTPDTILGKPVYTDPYVATATTGAKSIVFGDFSAYFVRLAGGIRFERSTDYAFNTDLLTYRVIARGDGALVDQTGAVKYFQGNATP